MPYMVSGVRSIVPDLEIESKQLSGTMGIKWKVSES